MTPDGQNFAGIATLDNQIGARLQPDAGRFAGREIDADLRASASAADHDHQTGAGDQPAAARPEADKSTATEDPMPPVGIYRPAGQKSCDHHFRRASDAARPGAFERMASTGELPPVAIPPDTIAALVALQRRRRFCIVSQSRINRSCEAFIATALGYRKDQDATARKAVWKQASAVRKAVEAGGEGHENRDPAVTAAFSATADIVRASAAGRVHWDTLRDGTEKEMRRLARTLPAYAWVQTVAGLSDLGLAIIVGEAGDLSNYATKERVWKRLGLAVIGGQRQRGLSDADAAAEHGYSPKRRAEVWAICSDAMFRKQWRGAKDDAPAHAIGPYGAIYARRKAATADREWVPARRDADARRIMTKAVIEDLWRVWNGKPPLAGTAAQDAAP